MRQCKGAVSPILLGATVMRPKILRSDAKRVFLCQRCGGASEIVV